MAKDYLPGNNFLMNENIAMKYGPDLAILLGYLIFIDELGITRRSQEQIIKKLEERNLIKKKVFGFPSKRYFKINHKRIEKILMGEEEL